MNGDLPPSSSDSGVRFSAAARAIDWAVSTDPVKEMRATPGCETSAAPASCPRPWTTLSTPGAQPGLLGQVGQQRARERSPLGRLEDDGAAGRERRSDLPGREHERRVPGRDQRRHAGRLVADAARGGARRVLVRLALPEVERGLGEVVDVVGAALDHALAHGLVGGSVVGRLDDGDLGDVPGDRLGEPHQGLVAAFGSEVAPGREGPLRGGDGLVDLVGGARGDVGEVRAVDGGAHVEAVTRGDSPPADVVIRRDGDAGDLDTVGHGGHWRDEPYPRPAQPRDQMRASSAGKRSRSAWGSRAATNRSPASAPR